MAKIKEVLIEELEEVEEWAQSSPWTIVKSTESPIIRYKSEKQCPVIEYHETRSGCTHQWEEKPLFTSSYMKCSKCGEEKNARY